MPVLPSYIGTNAFPDRPPSSDINPAAYGRDAEALAKVGGEIGQLGNQLVEARTNAIASDAAATAKSATTVAFAKMEQDAKLKHGAGGVAPGGAHDDNGNPVDANGAPLPPVSDPIGTAESLRQQMNTHIEDTLKQLPNQKAKELYRARAQPLADETYVRNLDWENQTRTKQYAENMQTRADAGAVDIYQLATTSPASAYEVLQEHLKDAKDDAFSKTSGDNPVLGTEDAAKVYKQIGKQYLKNYVDGIADSGSPTAVAAGRHTLANLPPEMAALMDGEMSHQFNQRFNQADHEIKMNNDMQMQLDKRALQEKRDNAQNIILDKIYSGKGTIKDILHGDGAILDPDKKETMIRVMEARLKEPGHPNAKNLSDVFQRIHAADDDPNRITQDSQLNDIYVKGGMTFEQLRKARSELQGKGTIAGQQESDQKRELIRAARGALTVDSLGNPDPVGEQNVAKFIANMNQRIDETKASGKPTKDLFDPNSQSSLYGSINSYKKSFQQVMQERVSTMQQAQTQAPAKHLSFEEWKKAGKPKQ